MDTRGRRALGLAASLYAVWFVVTYLLEGRIQTLLRPDATVARAAYALIANILVGIVGGGWVLSHLVRTGVITAGQAGFRSLSHAAIGVAAGSGLGLGLFWVEGPPTMDPVILANAFAQVIVVTIAEIIVCWCVVGSVVESLLSHRGRVVSIGAAVAVASLVFGVYHFAHSPPFNALRMVLLLSVVGLGTSAFFFATRDVYGAAAFHNFAGVFGVVQALTTADALTDLRRPAPALLAMAVLAVLVVVTAHVAWIRTARPAGAGALRQPH